MGWTGVVYVLLSVAGAVAGGAGASWVKKRLAEKGKGERFTRGVIRLGHLVYGLGWFCLGVVVVSGLDLENGQGLIFPVGVTFLWMIYAFLAPLIGVRGDLSALRCRAWEDFKRGTLE